MIPSTNHPPPYGKIGVLLVNLGTPEGTSYWPMRRYLAEFLSDRRVIETSPVLWLPVLHLMVLSKRPTQKGKDYEAIWNRELDEGPLKTVTRAQTEKLAARLSDAGDTIVVDWAMRYGKPAIAEKILALQAKGCDRLLVVPLYPQYCAATSATVADKTFDALKKMRWQPTLRIAAPFYERPVYIEALASTLRDRMAKAAFSPDRIIVSWHGIPKDYSDRGDPYYCHCAKTTRLLGEATGLGDKMLMTFQSQFGPKEWLQPYTLETVEGLPAEGAKNIMVIAPGFFADCLETLEELGVENQNAFLQAGGENFALVPCLNDGAAAIDVLEDVVRRETTGWL
ncbi:ferrochelatase [Rhodoblastus sphagnicola]|uniref:Ferrochelatase n=1 Tax=Rhodoblastus sphagnicola TaxID=333368 RepID=A0A2S6N9K7_9HYPH|nr:ferrochelatase [Rhodoblastus sphagnicola]MBB4200431.1 ferrochelatase [Rhodoblastus sphagnicola]PPQ31306.1 ferrochelatase [Rhodoblastus sphagnicola]